MIPNDFAELKTVNKPVLNGLVLAGGKSIRLGRDKSTIKWHGKEQRYYMVDLLKTFCREVFISCREEQRYVTDPDYNIIPDSYSDLGPYGAILSAFKVNAGCAWLIIACDLPLMDAKTLSYLVEQRDPRAMATTFKSPYDALPESLITIWESKSYYLLQSSLSLGGHSLRRILINNQVKIINAINTKALMNVNTKEEFEKAQQILQENRE